MPSWNELSNDRERDRWLGEMPPAAQLVEAVKCARSPTYFVHNYTSIYDKVGKRWIPFKLWQMQYWTLLDLHRYPLNVVLKARQEGFSWLAIAYNGLFKMLFRSIAKLGIFSKRDDEAVYMLGDERLKGMYLRLPSFLQAESIAKADGHTFALSNGSVARAFPTTGGDAYAMTDVILDEFDLVPDQNALMRAVKPTIDGGGSMTIVSRVDKDRPKTEFKALYQAASTRAVVEWDPEQPGRLHARRETCEGNGWNAIFCPWYAHPGRDQAWYEAERRETMDRTGSLDDLHEQYPATEEEALAARTLSKRIAFDWLKKNYQRRPYLSLGDAPGAPAIPGLEVYAAPVWGRPYVLGGDPAEGNPTSDDSALEILDGIDGEEVCALALPLQPSTFAAHCATLARWYQGARLMIERNNHGHAVLLWLADNAPGLEVLSGYDDRPGWNDTTRGKAQLYDTCADALRDGGATIHSRDTFDQLGSIEGSTLRAPEGMPDDRAVAYALAQLARAQGGGPPAGETVEVELAAYRRERRSVLWPG